MLNENVTDLYQRVVGTPGPGDAVGSREPGAPCVARRFGAISCKVYGFSKAGDGAEATRGATGRIILRASASGRAVRGRDAAAVQPHDLVHQI